MGNSPPDLGAREQAEPSGLPTGRIQSRLLCPVIASSARTERSPAMEEAWRIKGGCWTTRLGSLRLPQVREVLNIWFERLAFKIWFTGLVVFANPCLRRFHDWYAYLLRRHRSAGPGSADNP